MLDHGNQMRSMFLHFKWFPKGANLTITLVHSHLSVLRARGKVSPTLYIQADNATDNKNITMFSYLSMLVHKNWFSSVYLYFLQPGHTHEDIDQSSLITASLNPFLIATIQLTSSPNGFPKPMSMNFLMLSTSLSSMTGVRISNPTNLKSMAI